MYVNEEQAASIKLAIFNSIMASRTELSTQQVAGAANAAFAEMYGDKSKPAKRRAAKKK